MTAFVVQCRHRCRCDNEDPPGMTKEYLPTIALSEVQLPEALACPKSCQTDALLCSTSPETGQWRLRSLYTEPPWLDVSSSKSTLRQDTSRWQPLGQTAWAIESPAAPMRYTTIGQEPFGSSTTSAVQARPPGLRARSSHRLWERPRHRLQVGPPPQPSAAVRRRARLYESAPCVSIPRSRWLSMLLPARLC